MPVIHPWINHREGLGNSRRFQEAKFGRPLLLSNERRAITGVNPRSPSGDTIYDANIFHKFSTYKLSLEDRSGYLQAYPEQILRVAHGVGVGAGRQIARGAVLYFHGHSAEMSCFKAAKIDLKKILALANLDYVGGVDTNQFSIDQNEYCNPKQKHYNIINRANSEIFMAEGHWAAAIAHRWFEKDATLKSVSHNPYIDAYMTLADGISQLFGPRIEGWGGGGYDKAQWAGHRIEPESGMLPGGRNTTERAFLTAHLNIHEKIPAPAFDRVSHIAIDFEYTPDHKPYAAGIAYWHQDETQDLAPGSDGTQRGTNYIHHITGFYFLHEPSINRLSEKHKENRFPGCLPKHICWWKTDKDLEDLFVWAFQKISTGNFRGPQHGPPGE